MTKVVSEEIKQRRRINVMLLKSMIAKLKVLLLAALILVPARAWAGGIIPLGVADTDNDAGALMLFGVFDQRGGNTWIQLTNTNPAVAGQWFHIQIFDVSAGCDETDFYDFYTPFDTHVYDFGNFDSEKGGDARVFPDTSYGFFVATPVTGSGGNFVIGSALGNVRIVRDEGYEYRTNLNGLTLLSAVFDTLGALNGLNANYAIPFNNVNGNDFSDVYGIAVLPGFDFNTFTGTGTVSAGGNIFAGFSASIWDQNENPESCTPVAFACNLDDANLRNDILDKLGSNFTLGFDLGISNAYPVSRVSAPDGDHICSGLQDVGQLRIEFGITALQPPTVVFNGFYGLNNGDGEGSMDSFISLPFDSINFLDVYGIAPILNQLCTLPFVSCP